MSRGRTIPLGPAFPRTLRAARRGRQAAWDALYREFAPALLGYARAQRAPDPEDLVGEVFLDVVRSLGRFHDEDEDSFRAWLFTIARRRLIDARRASGRRPSAATEPVELERLGGTSEDELEALSLEAVLALLARVSEEQREVLVLRVVAGLRLNEIAEVTGRHPEAVKALSKRGLARLRHLLSADGRAADDPALPEPSAPPDPTPRRSVGDDHD